MNTLDKLVNVFTESAAFIGGVFVGIVLAVLLGL